MTNEQKMVKESFFNLRNKLIKSFEKIDGGKFNLKAGNILVVAVEQWQ